MSKAGVAQRDGAAAAKTVAEVKRRKRVEIVKITVDGAEVDAKECTGCGIVKDLTKFCRKTDGVGGRNSICLECANKRGEVYRRNNREEINKKGAIYRANNAEKIREGSRRYRRENKDKTKAYYWEIARDRSVARSKEYRLRNKCEIREKGKLYYNANRQKIIKRVTDYRVERPEISRASIQRRKSRKRHLPFVIDSQHMVSEFKEVFNNVCALAGTNVKLHIEHYIPLAIGHGGTYVGNIYPLEATLNCSKKDTNPFEWIRTRPDIDANRFDAVVAYLADLNGLTTGEYRQFVDWCYANPRTIDEIKRDNSRYGFTVSSVELWREATGIALPLRIDFRPTAESEREVSAM